VQESQRRAQQLIAAGSLLALSACAATPRPQPTGEPAGVRMTMADLHRAGGVPHGWQFRPPPGDPKAGRQAFVDFGCFTCHTVQGENFPAASRSETDVGPDLTGMGTHHPASYFAESILNPDAVLVDGPGYVGEDGRSMMPAYSDMTLGQLADLVAYLASLTGGGTQSSQLVAGNTGGATDFVAQVFEVDPEKVDELYDWFEGEEFRTYDGLVSIDTYIGRNGERLQLVAIFGFDNEVSLARFLEQARSPNRAKPDFIQPEHLVLRSAPVYKAIGLLVP
jgi:mono/diheme cytochrome c family protein